MHIAGRVLVGASVVAVVPCFATGAVARVTCTYAGPPANLLTVKASARSEPVVSRADDEIRVIGYGGPPARCAGGTPTVLNTDKIEMRVSGEGADLNLVGGPLAPGATPEPDGASDIEIEVTGTGVILDVHGTAAADELHWVQASPNPGLNLNPGAGDTDADVTIFGAASFIVANGGAGNDTIIPEPGEGFEGDGVFSTGGAGDDVLVAPDVAGGILWGGPGSDLITAGSGFDILRGGPGRDRLDGGGGDDDIHGGGGRDVIFGGPGLDNVYARDGTRDTIDCGTGGGRVNADLRDLLNGCERVRHRT